MIDKGLHTKHRPPSFDGIYGNEELIKSLKTKISGNKVSSILLYGIKGCGKTTIARIIAKELGANSRTTKEFDLAAVGLKGKALDIRENAKYLPFGAKCKVFIFDEVQDSSKGFQVSMLKELEEPRPNVYYILCTTEPEKLLGTIRSRCLTYKVKPLEGPVISKLLKEVVEKELGDEKDRISGKVIREIARSSNGIPREALVLLDMIIDLDDEDEMISTIKSNIYVDTSDEVRNLCRALMDKVSWKVLAPIVGKIKDEPEQVRYAILTWMGTILLKGENVRAAELIELFSDTYIYSKRSGLIVNCYYATKV